MAESVPYLFPDNAVLILLSDDKMIIFDQSHCGVLVKVFDSSDTLFGIRVSVA